MCTVAYFRTLHAGHGLAAAARSFFIRCDIRTLTTATHTQATGRTVPQPFGFFLALSPLMLGPLPSRCHLPGDRAIQEMEPEDPKFSRFASRLRFRTDEYT